MKRGLLAVGILAVLLQPTQPALADAPALGSAARGAVVFERYCSLCHGTTAHGDGRAARLHVPPPVDLTKSRVNDTYRDLIIRRGSQGVGRSNGMPPWEGELSDQQIRDVVAYLGTIGAAAH